MALIWLLLLLSVEDAQQPAFREVTVDVIEVNHVYTLNDANKLELRYEQVIFWEWERAEATYVVRAWRWIQHVGHAERRGGYWICRIHENGKLFEVRAPVCRETWTAHDPEMEDAHRYSRKYRWTKLEQPLGP